APAVGAQSTAEADDEVLAEAALLETALKPWKGDLDGMVGRNMIRVAIPFGIATYFLDGGAQKGPTYDLAVAFEQSLKKKLGVKDSDLTMVVVPARRDEIFQMLVDGKADIVAGTLTITEERARQVDFSLPFMKGVNEVVITGPEVPAGAGFDVLAGVEIHVRPASSYFPHLAALNEERAKAGETPLTVVAADEILNTEDLVEMVNAGLLPATVADEAVADFLGRIFDNIVVHNDLVISGPNDFAWAFRKDSPQLAAAVNEFAAQARKGTKTGNIILQKYLKSTKWAEQALDTEGEGRLRNLVELFKEYSGQYGFDWLMIGAQGYQESRLDQSARSHAGAIGVMQLLPSTAADPNVDIPDITTERNNVHAGVRYLRFLRDRYFSEPQISDFDRVVFSFAAYNAGPGNIAKSRRLAAKMGLDPDVWFDNVELATARAVSREPVIYVRNIYKYYVAYRRIADHLSARQDQAPN
ncbi:MAG TPA: transporter substrate-binding domain-containing protein, partial [Kiloniellaceae bacterium]